MKTEKFYGLIAFVSLVLGVLFDGMSDGLMNAHNNAVNWHTAEVFSMVFYFVAICCYIAKELYIQSSFTFKSYCKTCLIMLGLFALTRFSLFDYVHNYFFNVNIFYVGSTSFIDKMYVNYVAKFFPPAFLLMLRLFIFIILFFRITDILYKNKNHDRKIRN